MALPRSCIKQAQRTSKGAAIAAACCNTIITCKPVSISGWCSALCGTPHKASTSGNSTRKAPQARNTSNMRPGCASIKPVDSSAQTRSGTRAATSPALTISRISTAVSGAALKAANRAAKRARRRMRTGSSRKASVQWRRVPSRRSAMPPNESTTEARSKLPSGRTSVAATAIALMLKSRRPRSCSRVTDASACTINPR